MLNSYLSKKMIYGLFAAFKMANIITLRPKLKYSIWANDLSKSAHVWQPSIPWKMSLSLCRPKASLVSFSNVKVKEEARFQRKFQKRKLKAKMWLFAQPKKHLLRIRSLISYSAPFIGAESWQIAPIKVLGV